MDYEKKYKELVGKIKNAYLYAQTDSTKAVLEDILPELTESEDERIRKALIELVKFSKRSCFEILKDQSFNIVSMDAMLAWLEKQGKGGEE